MINNIKVDNKLVNFVKEHQGPVIVVGTGVLIAAIILSTNEKPKEVFPMYMPTMVKAEEHIDEPVQKEKDPFFITRYVRVALNQIMRLEPMTDGKFVDRIIYGYLREDWHR